MVINMIFRIFFATSIILITYITLCYELFYNIETGLYYLQSRYYDAEVGRFLNADGYMSTGQGVLGYNMFAYCGNNPASRTDTTGRFWSEIGNFFSGVWGGIKNWAKNTFGAGYTSVSTSVKDEKELSKFYPLISAKVGVKKSTIVTKHGDSSKPISVYATQEISEPEEAVKSSKVGIKINIADVSANLSFGADDLGISFSLKNKDITSNIGLKTNLSELQTGIEWSTTVGWDENNLETTYTRISVNGLFLLAICMMLQTGGQPVQAPSYACKG